MLSRKYLTPARLSERGRRYPTSRTWTACKDGGMIFNKGLKWSISNGETVNAWDDFWLASSPLRKQIQAPLAKGEGNLSVKDFLYDGVNISFVLHDSIMQEIRGIPLTSNPACEDILIWAFSKDGSFSLSSAYMLAKGLNPLNLSTSKLWVWKAKTTPRIKFFLWQCYHSSIPTKEVLGSRGFNLNDTCELCGRDTKSIIHVLHDCNVARNVWRKLGINDANQEFFGAPLVDWLKNYCESCDSLLQPQIP